jgi:hypothetical protein
MNAMSLHELPDDPNSPERKAIVQRVILLSRVATARAWHEEEVSDPNTTEQEERFTLLRVFAANLRLLEFDRRQDLGSPELEE